MKKLRAEGEALHQAGKHQGSMATLTKALKILSSHSITQRLAKIQ